MIDFTKINLAALAHAQQLLLSWFPAGKHKGAEFCIGDLTGAPGDSLSINLQSGIWKDFAAGTGGRDLISLYAAINNINNPEAAKRLADVLGVDCSASSQARRPPPEYDALIYPVPADAPPLPEYIWRKNGNGLVKYPITHRWAYRSPLGDLLGYTVRIQPPEGKEILPYTFWSQKNGPPRWRQKSLPAPRPLYGLDRLAHAPGAQVAIVEGEKCCQALQGLIDGTPAEGAVVACTWPGGCQSVGKADWSPLRGRSCVLWPDNDESGHGAMRAIAGQLKGLKCRVRLVKIPDGKPLGWDVADAIIEDKWDLDRIVQWIRNNRFEIDVPAVRPAVRPTVIPTPPPTPPESPPIDNKYGQCIINYGEKQSVNQSAIAFRYVQESGIAHDPATNRFYIYEPSTGLWRHQTDSATMRELGNLFQAIAKAEGLPELVSKRTANLLHSLVALTRGLAERPDIFINRPSCIHVMNGMLVFENGAPVIKPFAADYYSRNRSEYRYDPTAKCPRFLDSFLAPAMPAEDMSLVQRYFGQCLLGVNPSQTFLILRGTPGGGKGTLTNIIESIVGLHNATELRIAQLAERFELFRYVDKSLLCGKDVPGNFLNQKPTHIIKSLVGGDRLSAEAKHGNDSFTINGQFNVIITTNTRLHIKLDSDFGAWRRRMLIVDYDRAAAEKPIPNLDIELLDAEGPGILAWAVEGAVALLAELREHGKILLTDKQQPRVDDLLYESDSIRSFAKDKLMLLPGADLSSHEITTAYRDYCEERGWEPLRDRQFQSELPDAMLELFRAIKRNDIVRDGKSCRGWRGVGLKTDRDPWLDG